MFSNFRSGVILLISVLAISILLFPSSSDILDTPIAKSLKKIELHVEKMQKNKKSSIAVWREFQASLIEEFSCIDLNELSEEEISYMVKKLKNLALPIVKSVMTQGAKELNNFSDYERYVFLALVDSSLKMVKKGSIAYRFINRMKKKLSLSTRAPFEYLKGEVLETLPINQVKFFSWNTCILPGALAKVHAGLQPWQHRLDLILKQIKEQNADIICLQEVYSEAASLKLYENLKDKYAHFYINIGPTSIPSELLNWKLNSGLFIASKFPLKNPYFEAFSFEKGGSQMNKGFFSAIVGSTDLSFINAHLEPFDNPLAQLARVSELEQMISYMKTSLSKVKLLMGDLNIAFGSQEPAENLLHAHFYDPYNKNRVEITKHSRTFSDHFVSVSEEGQSAILDYFLIMQDRATEQYAFVIERVEGFDELTLQTKGSDHHGLFSQVVFPYLEK